MWQNNIIAGIKRIQKLNKIKSFHKDNTNFMQLYETGKCINPHILLWENIGFLHELFKFIVS